MCVLTMIAAVGCASEPKRVDLGVQGAPNPNGCYVFVYERPDWQGAGVVLNGPGRWRSLERLQVNQIDWRNRIRSIDVGPAAVVTLYTDQGLTGASRRFPPGSKPARLDLPDGVESLEVSCQSTTP